MAQITKRIDSSQLNNYPIIDGQTIFVTNKNLFYEDIGNNRYGTSLVKKLEKLGENSTGADLELISNQLLLDLNSENERYSLSFIDDDGVRHTLSAEEWHGELENHTHGNITKDGRIGEIESRVIVTSEGGKLIAKVPGTSFQYLDGLGNWTKPAVENDIIEASGANFPLPGKSNKLYLDLDTNLLYRYDVTNTAYLKISPDLEDIEYINGGNAKSTKEV